MERYLAKELAEYLEGQAPIRIGIRPEERFLTSYCEHRLDRQQVVSNYEPTSYVMVVPMSSDRD